MSEAEAATEFLKQLFGPTTEQPVYICSLANERDDPHEPGERRVSTRDADEIARFVRKWDRPRRGLFFAVGTVAAGAKREKASICESIGLHADLDLKNIEADEPDVRAALRSLRLPPSALVRSGNGLHAYWLFREGMALPPDGEERQEAVARIEQALRLLADHVAGDLQVAEISRLMRLPGTHNTKDGAWKEVVCEFTDGPRYELDDLEEWLSEAAPVLRRRVREAPGAAAPPAVTNPFLAAAAKLGYRPPVDVETRLSQMTFGGAGDAAIHATQLAVSASLLNSGADVDDVVETLLTATQAAAGELGERWNWKRERAAIQKMCETWLKKHPKPRPSLDQVRAREEVVNGGEVVQLAAARQERARKKPKPASAPDKQAIANVVADGVVAAIRAVGQDILLTEGEVWLYANGIWHTMTPADQQWMLTLVQTGFETLGEPAKPANLNAAWKRLTEHPDLFQRDVQWAGGDVIVCQNGVLEIASRKFHPHAPNWYARRKIGVAYDPTAKCPQFLRLLEAMFADRLEPADRAAFMHVVQAWAGSAMAVSHLSREERKALILVGPSRTGKTELSRIIRLLIGEPIATPSVSEVSERFGLSSLYEAAAWIRDDAINEGDDLDPQRFKTIVTGEPIDIERKHKPAVPGVELALPVLLTTNALPRARDKSDAIFNRSLVLEMTNVVSEAAAHALRQQLGTPRGETVGTHIMATEGPGVLNWALDGLASLLERGSYDLPESVRAAIQRFKDDNNPVGEWARTAVVRSAGSKVSRADLMCAYHGWQREQDGDEARAFGARAFFPRLRAAAPWSGDMTDNTGRRFVTGLALSDEGLQLWDLHNQGPQLKGGSKGNSITKFEVNKPHVATPAETIRKYDNGPRF
jgi:P4 family phage/plasmid primase-like protien